MLIKMYILNLSAELLAHLQVCVDAAILETNNI